MGNYVAMENLASRSALVREMTALAVESSLFLPAASFSAARISFFSCGIVFSRWADSRNSWNEIETAGAEQGQGKRCFGKLARARA